MKDWHLNTFSGPPVHSAETLLASLRNGVVLMTGLSSFKLLFSASAPPSPELVDAIVDNLEDLELNVEIASGLLLLGRGQEEKVLQFLVDTDHVKALPHLMSLALERASLNPTLLPILAEHVAFYFRSWDPNLSVRYLGLFEPHLDYFFEVLHKEGTFEEFVKSASFESRSGFAALERLFRRKARHPIALSVIRLAPTVLLNLDVEATTMLLLGLPQGRRLIFNLIYSMELQFATKKIISRDLFEQWLELLACATSYVGALLSDDERPYMKDFHYLSRYLPLYDRVISAKYNSFSNATVTHALDAMINMARFSPEIDREATFEFARQNQPELTARILNED